VKESSPVTLLVVRFPGDETGKRPAIQDSRDDLSRLVALIASTEQRGDGPALALCAEVEWSRVR
jgi:hypothetical protein